MLCGFLLGMNGNWIVRWTKFSPQFVNRVCSNLSMSGIWRPSEKTIHGKWCDVYFAEGKHSKRERFEADLAFWLDAMAANGDITRETRDGEPYYAAKR